MYRSGMKYNIVAAVNSTRQAKHDTNGTDQLNMLQQEEKKSEINIQLKFKVSQKTCIQCQIKKQFLTK